MRIGVNTGEAVTGAEAGGGFFTAGDMVNVAARLEQAARPGDVLLGHDTFRLVRHAVDAEPVAPLTVKGKAAALEAFRLLAVAPDARGRPQRPRAPLVGRERERQQLLDAFDRAVAGGSCELFTVLGAAGVGKSRLVAEVVDTLEGAATVAAGRCLPYGEGLTWWPLVDALGASGLFEQVAADPQVAATRAGEVLKPGGEPVAPEEAFWAVRTVLEALARRRPLVLAVDDLQWAEPTFMDLLDHVAGWARDAPLLLLVTARPELLDGRPRWGEGRANATNVALEPLADAQAADLLRHLLGGARLGARAAARILDVTEGNPLFVEEVVAMLIDDGVLSPGGGRDAIDPAAIAVPPTIQALLAARLDRLGPLERAVIEAASIEGKEFARERVRGAGRGRIDRRPAARARAQGPDLAARDRRGQIPLRPPADPRRGVRGDAEGAARRPARALRGPDRCPPRRRRRAARLPLRARRAAPARARRGRRDDRRARGPCVDQPERRGQAGRPARRPRRRERAARTRGRPGPRRRRRARRAAAGARRLAVRGGPHDRRDARSRRGDRPRARTAHEGTRAGRARARAARGGDERRNRAGAARRGRRPARARARGRRVRAMPRLVAARPGRLDRGACGPRRRRLVPGRGLRAARGRRARAVRDPRLARDRGRVRAHPGRRRDPALRGVPRASSARARSWMASIDQPAGVAARDDGRVRAGRPVARGGQRDPRPARQPRREREPSRSARQAARGAARARRATAARGRRDARVDERRRAAGDDDRHARAGRLRPGPPPRGRRALPRGRGGRGAPTTS